MKTPNLKQDYDLTQQDFESSRIWVNVHGVDERKKWYRHCDEATFRPWLSTLPTNPTEQMLLVSAQFTLANGHRYPGAFYCSAIEEKQTASCDPAISITQPRIFINGKTFSFWGGRTGISTQSRQELFRLVGGSATDIFPISFEYNAECKNCELTGTIEGFYHLNDKRGGGSFICIDQSDECRVIIDQRKRRKKLPLRTVAMTHLSEGSFDAALEVATAWIESDPQNPEVWSTRSYIYLRKGDLEKAVEDAKAAVACKPGIPDEYIPLTRLLVRAGRYSECLYYTEIAFNSDFNEPTIADHLRTQLTFDRARASYETGLFQEALELLELVYKGHGQGSSTDKLRTKSALIRACKAQMAKNKCRD